MYNNFRPTGSVIQLMDGRIFKRNQKNLWEDINTGVTITEQQLGTMISSASFSSDASGGGRSRKPISAPSVPQITRLSGTFNDIVLTNVTEEQTNNLSVILGDATPDLISLRITTSGTFNGSDGFLYVYKNNTLITTLSASESTSDIISSPEFDNGDLLKFGAQTDTGMPFNFNVTVEIYNRGYPTSTLLDTFNVSATFSL